MLTTLYMKIRSFLPRRVRETIESLPIHPLYLLHLYKEAKTIRSGPPYYPSHESISIDITTACNLRCVDCNRSCGKNQVETVEHISVDQIEKFIAESITHKRRWKTIYLEGGEPSLHPQFTQIVNLLIQYKLHFSRRTTIKIMTNGFNQRASTIIDWLTRNKVDVYNSRKTSSESQTHYGFNVAPCDLPEFKECDYSGGCFLPAMYGVGLMRNGFYPHPICGGIDRIFGFDIGRKSLPDRHDTMRDQFNILCPLCGLFRYMAQHKIKLFAFGGDAGGLVENSLGQPVCCST